MRHRKKFNHLKRKVGHRKALLRNLSNSLIEHKRINTTLAKAKALRVFIEPIITKAKQNNLHAHQYVFSKLGNKEAVKELFGTVIPKVGDRPGGYVRIIRTGARKSDSAEMAMIELVDFNEVYTTSKAAAAGSSRRRRRRGGKGGAAKAAATTAVASQEEE